MKTLYVFGNEYLHFDAFARRLAEKLEKEENITIVNCRSPDDLLDADEEEIVILDVVKGIDSPIMITDPRQIRTRTMMSLHDFDLGFFLNLLEGLGMSKKIKIIGVPQQGDITSILMRVKQWI